MGSWRSTEFRFYSCDGYSFDFDRFRQYRAMYLPMKYAAGPHKSDIAVSLTGGVIRFEPAGITHHFQSNARPKQPQSNPNPIISPIKEA
jgi:hypothetical protein